MTQFHVEYRPPFPTQAAVVMSVVTRPPLLRILFATVIASLVSLCQTVAAATADAALESAVRSSHVFREHLKGENIKLECVDGVITLDGTVSDLCQRVLAQETVLALPGVREVHNGIVLRSGPPAEARIRTILLLHRNGRPHAEGFGMTNGIVVLRGGRGGVESGREIAAWLDGVEGVTGVRCDETLEPVTPPPSKAAEGAIDDPSVTALVKASLMAHRATAGIPVRVRTVNGVVTVAGPCRGPEEALQVARMTALVRGVGEVVSKMGAGPAPPQVRNLRIVP